MAGNHPGNQELFQAFDRLVKGVGAISTTAGLMQAQGKVDDINKSQMSEIEKRKALTQVSQGLTMQLSAAGADPTQIKQSTEAFKPAEIKNSNDALAQGFLSGDESLKGLGAQLQSAELATQTGEKQKDRGFEWAKMEAGHKNALELKGMEQEAAAKKGERLPPTLIKPMQDALKFGAQAQGLLDRFKKDPKAKQYVGLIKQGKLGDAQAYFNKEMAGFRGEVERYALGYRKEMTGSAAGIEEDKRIMNAIANLGTNPEAFASILEDHINAEGSRYNAAIEPLSAQGYSTKGFEWKYGSAKQGQQQGQPQGDGTVGLPSKTTGVMAPPAGATTAAPAKPDISKYFVK